MIGLDLEGLPKRIIGSPRPFATESVPLFAWTTGPDVAAHFSTTSVNEDHDTSGLRVLSSEFAFPSNYGGRVLRRPHDLTGSIRTE
jgi:hypothetical protein